MLAASPGEPSAHGVDHGPRWYRTRIRRLGPFLALLPPFALGAVAWVALGIGSDRWTSAFGLFAGVIAAPGLLVAGAPFGDDSVYPVAAAASSLLWLTVGWLAARRATRSPMADWRDFGRELIWLSAGVAVGATAALVVASTLIGESLI